MELPWAHVMVIYCCVINHPEAKTVSYIYFAHKSALWVGLDEDNLCAPLGDGAVTQLEGWVLSPSGGLPTHVSGDWRGLSGSARTPTPDISMWLLGFLTRWRLGSKMNMKKKKKARW